MTAFTNDVMKRFASDRSVSIEAAFDAELQEVREVLRSTAKRKRADGMCWCEVYTPKLGHSEFCQRARALSERLRV